MHKYMSWYYSFSALSSSTTPPPALATTPPLTTPPTLLYTSINTLRSCSNKHDLFLAHSSCLQHPLSYTNPASCTDTLWTLPSRLATPLSNSTHITWNTRNKNYCKHAPSPEPTDKRSHCRALHITDAYQKRSRGTHGKICTIPAFLSHSRKTGCRTEAVAFDLRGIGVILIYPHLTPPPAHINGRSTCIVDFDTR